jgi:chromate transporter
LYLVSVGYFIDGLPGALAGLIALLTPAFLVIPLMRWMGAYAKVPRIRGAIRAVVLGSAGLLMAATVPMARDAATGPLLGAIIAASFLTLAFTRVETWWVMGGAAAVGLAAKLLS